MTKERRTKRRKAAAGAKEPGDLIDMHDGQREFLRVRGKIVENPEMELCMLSGELRSDMKAQFGTEPLPWQTPWTQQEMEHLKTAKTKKFKCKNDKCDMHDVEAIVDYAIIAYKNEVSHSDDPIQNSLLIKKLGRKVLVENYVEVRCKKCRNRIQFVKYNLTNRRAAEDPMVSGPHQIRRRYR